MTTAPSPQTSPFFVPGGTLLPEAPSYVCRAADEDLYQALVQAQYAFVLNARQLGKSSLMVRVAHRLRQQGIRIAVLDLSRLGTSVTQKQWYQGLVQDLIRRVRLNIELKEVWNEDSDLAPFQQWMTAVEKVLSALPGEDLVIFIDEIDQVRALGFSTDEFFAGIREMYNRRSEDPCFKRLSFCLLGVASPSDLIRDTRVTPFNISRRIELTDFTEQEAAGLMVGLQQEDLPADALLKRVLYWTGGHPALTQRLCHAVVETHANSLPAVDALCEALYFTKQARSTENNLVTVSSRLLANLQDTSALLALYRNVWEGRRVGDSDVNPLVRELKLCGVVRSMAGKLQVRNRIYQRVVDRAWIQENMPDREIRRQRAAYRQGVLRATAIFAAFAVVMIVLGVTASLEANRATRAEKDQLKLTRNMNYGGSLNSAFRNWDANDTPGAQKMLERARQAASWQDGTDHRGFEWFYLHHLFNRERLRLVGYSRLAFGAVFSSDGTRLITADMSGTVRVADARTGATIRSWSAHNAATVCLAVSTGGQVAATRSADGTAKVWETSSGRLLNTLSGPRNDSSPLALSGDGRNVAVLDRDTLTINIWDSKTSKRLSSFRAIAPPSGLAFSHNGRFVAAVGDRFLQIFDLHGKLPARTLQDKNLYLCSAAFSPNDSMMVTGNKYDGLVRLWDTHSLRPLATMPGHTEWVSMVTFSPDNRQIASSSWDNTCRVFDVKLRKQVSLIRGHNDRINSVGYSRDGRYLVTSGGHEVRVWNLPVEAEFERVQLPREQNGFAWAPDGRTVAITLKTGIDIWDTATWRQRVHIASNRSKLVEPVLSHDGSVLVALDTVGLRVWNVARQAEPTLIDTGPAGARMAFCDSDRTLAVGLPNGTVRFWDLAAGKWFKTLLYPPSLATEIKTHITSLVLSPNGRLVAASYGNPASLVVWEIGTGRPLLTISRLHSDMVFDMAFSPDGSRLASASWDRTIKVISLQKSAPIEELSMGQPARSVSFSRDGRTLAGCDAAGEVKLWNTTIWQEVARFRALPIPSLTGGWVSFLPDGRTLAAWNRNGDMRLLRTRSR